MPVTLTDEQFEKLEDLLTEAGWACQGTAYAKMQDALAIVRSLTREPAPAARPNPAASRGTPVSPLNEPFNQPMIGKRNVVATHRVAAPSASACQHLKALKRYGVHDNGSMDSRDDCPKFFRLMNECSCGLDAALATDQPCAAPGDCKHREIARKLCQRLHTVECGVECTDLCRDAYRRIDRACAPGEAGELIDDTRPAGIASFEDHVKAAVRDLNRGAVRWVIRWLQTLKAAPAPAPSEAGEEWELWHCGNNSEDVQFFASQAPKGGPYRVYRRRAPEREGGAR